MLEAIVIVVWRGDRTLVIQRGPRVQRSGYWTPPSGRVEAGETAADAVVREAREELGLVVMPRREVWSCPTDDGVYTLHWWLVDASDDAPLAPDPYEVAEARWVTVDEYLELEPRFDDDARFFTDVWPTLTSGSNDC